MFYIHLLSNGVIAISYLWIAGFFFKISKSLYRPGNRHLFWILSAFILSCGIGHALESLSYEYSSFWHIVTAIVSAGSATFIIKNQVQLIKSATADSINEKLLEEWPEPLGLYQVENEDLRIIYQNKAAIENLEKDNTGLILGEVFPSHLLSNGALFGASPEKRLIDLYIAAADGVPWEGDLCYLGDGVDGWYRVRAQQAGKNLVMITWRDISREKRNLESQVIFNRVQKSLTAREFVLHYQPIISLESGKIAGYEALVRWPRDDGTIRNPGEFLYAIEGTELINSLCWQVASMACNEIERWNREGVNEGLYLAINIAPFTISSFEFESRFNEILDSHNAPRDRIVIEITEEIALDKPVVPKVERLKLSGLRIGIDDFGTGQTSFKNLYSYPADLIKIDRTFTIDVDTNPVSQELIITIVKLAKILNMSVVAEGVETQEAADWLKNNGVQYGQGWLWGKAQALK